jgi:hypothetical protein
VKEVLVTVKNAKLFCRQTGIEEHEGATGALPALVPLLLEFVVNREIAGGFVLTQGAIGQ